MTPSALESGLAKLRAMMQIAPKIDIEPIWPHEAAALLAKIKEADRLTDAAEELREQVRKDAAEIGGLRAAVTQLGGTFGGDETGSDKTLKVGDRVVFRHPNCRFTSSDRGTVVNAQPLTVKWDGDIRSRPNPEYVFREIGPLPGGDA